MHSAHSSGSCFRKFLPLVVRDHAVVDSGDGGGIYYLWVDVTSVIQGVHVCVG